MSSSAIDLVVERTAGWSRIRGADGARTPPARQNIEITNAMPAKISLVGKRFGRLFVLRNAPLWRYPNGRSGRMVMCQCDCGNEVTVFNQPLRDGLTKSCGCLNREIITKHSHAPRRGDSRTYLAWCNMKARCFNENSISYHNYGGRGVTVWPGWVNDFEAFLRDVGECPPGMSLATTLPEMCVGRINAPRHRIDAASRLLRSTV
jgi:hypothetical protein